jgi:short-subunit dehydrogenase
MHALITGASSGIGEAIARQYAARGWSVSLVARRKNLLDDLAASLNTPTFVRAADLADPGVVQPVIDECVAALGPIDALINNAGIQYVEPVEGVSVERMRTMFEVDLLAPLTMIQHALPSMLERKTGTIINIASVAAITHTPGMCHYNGAKAGLAACSESMRVELEPTGVHVLTVYPGPVRSPMEEAGRQAFTESWATRYIPTGDADVLAKKIFEAMQTKADRIVYPASYAMTRFSRVSSQWFTDKFTPPLKKP